MCIIDRFYTPRSVVELIVAMIEPHDGRVYDPCCGSGGMFVQSERFVEDREGRIDGQLAIYGQESNYNTCLLYTSSPVTPLKTMKMLPVPLSALAL